MARNLDMTALRSFVAVAEAGGVTRAAGFLNLTQSAVSMQLKRLEVALDVSLLDRSARTIALTGAGEQLLSYARRMLALNDEALSRLTDQAFEGELVLGVPGDIVYPAIPQVLNRFAADYPRVKVQLLSSYTRKLKALFAKGDCDVILTTEHEPDERGETLSSQPLVWVGAPGGTAWRQRPLRLAFENSCIFRARVIERLDAAGIPWEMAVESRSTRAIEASVSADLAVHAALGGMLPPYMEPLSNAGGLPELGHSNINLYVLDERSNPLVSAMANTVRQAFQAI